jgi:hypothetical protein
VIREPLNYLTLAGSLSSRSVGKKIQGPACAGNPFWSPRLPATATAQLALRDKLASSQQYVVESRNDDPDEVGDDFAARLYELAPSSEHMLGLSVEVLSILKLREASN